MTRHHPLDLSLYLVTDSGACRAAGRDVVATVADAVAGGVTAVQLREKDASARDFLRLVTAVSAVLPESVALFVNDRVDVFAAARARGVRVTGVHVGQSDLPVAAVRALAGPEAVIGLSASTPEQLAAAAADPARVAYVGIGALHPTTTKTDAPDPLGHARFARLCGASALPAVAIGGVTADDLPRLRSAGAAGAAVVSAICSAPDARAAAGRLAAAWAEVEETPPVAPPRVLSIAGTDPTGGAGIQADLKAIAANGGYGMAVTTALVAQNTRGVRSVHVPPVEFLTEQLDAVSDDVRIDAVKIGMIGAAEIAGAVEEWLARVRPPLVVLDPVMVATSGDLLLEQDAVEALRRLAQRVDLVTPNLPELAVLAGEPPAADWPAALEQAGRVSRGLGVRVYAKGGHLDGDDAPDALVDARGGAAAVREFRAPRVRTRNTHGTGCSLSSALATRLAHAGDWLRRGPRAGRVARAGGGGRRVLGGVRAGVPGGGAAAAPGGARRGGPRADGAGHRRLPRPPPGRRRDGRARCHRGGAPPLLLAVRGRRERPRRPARGPPLPGVDRDLLGCGLRREHGAGGGDRRGGVGCGRRGRAGGGVGCVPGLRGARARVLPGAAGAVDEQQRKAGEKSAPTPPPRPPRRAAPGRTPPASSRRSR